MQPLSKDQLKIEMKRFYLDKDRGISIKLFAELAGVNMEHFYDVFIYDKQPLTEYIQKRVNKAYKVWKEGGVRVMQRRDQTRFVEFKKDPKVPFFPHMKIDMSSGQPKVVLGPRNRHDYSQMNNILSKT
jgi:hypothetical protein